MVVVGWGQAMTSCSTILASFLTPLLASKLAGAVVPLSGAALFTTTLKVVLLPVILGMGLRLSAPDSVSRLQKGAPALCVVLVALICGAIVAQNATVLRAGASGLDSLLRLVGAVLTMHAGGFALGYGAAYVAGLSTPVQRTVSIETGMQNSALGTVLALRAISPAAVGAPGTMTANALAAQASLPGAVSATVHSVLGSALAGLWRLQDRKNKNQPAPYTSTS